MSSARGVLVCAAALGCASEPATSGDSSTGDTGLDTSSATETPSLTSPTSVDTTATSADESSEAGSSGTGPVGCALTDVTERTLTSGMAVRHRFGQTFVTWSDRAQGAAGEGYRYRVYRSVTPIIDDADLTALEPIASGILNHSGQLFGSAFTPPQRLDSELPMAVLDDEGEPLPTWSGLWTTTAETDDCAYYAVIATDLDGTPVESVAVDVNATVEPIAERVGSREPIKVYDSATRGKYSPNTEITGTRGLPLFVTLHGSNAQGGGAGDYGDYWLYFGDDTMGWQSGLPGVFSVEETHSGPQTLLMRNRDTIVMPAGSGGLETMWFGYVAEPDGGRHAYPFTEQRLLWMLPWVMTRYAVDDQRVYLGGGSMGAWGTVSFGLRRRELFAAIFPDRPRFRQTSLTSVTTDPTADDTLPDGTLWSVHHDAVGYVSEHGADLPFLGWNCGRQDGFASWQEQVDMVAAMTAAHHGFAFAWNDGDHSGGSAAAAVISMWYPPERFARDLSYPAFGNSSIDDDPGAGDPLVGDLEGGINLGFVWTDPVDQPEQWSCAISNGLANTSMTVDVTPRRAQQFTVEPGEQLDYATSSGAAGTATADADGVVTIPLVEIVPSTTTTVTLMRR